MRNSLSNNRIRALITILILAVGSTSVVGTTQVTMASQIGKACVFFACGNANITGGTSSSGGGGGGGGGGQPTLTTGTLTVTKKTVCPESYCTSIGISPTDFHITVTGDNPKPDSFVGSATGTEVTLGPGNYKVDEPDRCEGGSFVCVVIGGFTFVFLPAFVADCTGTINAGQTKDCVITNTLHAVHSGPPEP